MKKWLIALFVVLVSGGSSSDGLESFIPLPVYQGQGLTVGIVGDIPKVREETIRFIKIDLEDLHDLSGLDAVFIDRSHLEEASKPEYARIYEENALPFIFIESEKMVLAFTEEDVSYDDAIPLSSGDYMIGIANHKKTHFGVGLYNGIKNERTIEDSYSILFSMLDRFKTTGEVTFVF